MEKSKLDLAGAWDYVDGFGGPVTVETASGEGNIMKSRSLRAA
jgi:hypothetical protein